MNFGIVTAKSVSRLHLMLSNSGVHSIELCYNGEIMVRKYRCKKYLNILNSELRKYQKNMNSSVIFSFKIEETYLKTSTNPGIQIHKIQKAQSVVHSKRSQNNTK